ncbi:MAG: TerB family tellurite resistance protein, partial [Rhodospirillaceae bacterium]
LDPAPKGRCCESGQVSDEVILAAAFLMVEAAHMDGDFADEEADRVRSLLKSHFELTDARLESLLSKALTLRDESNEWYRQARTLKDAFSYEERVDLVEMLWDVVYADDVLHDYEANMMRRINGLLYVDDPDSGAARKRVLARKGLSD